MLILLLLSIIGFVIVGSGLVARIIPPTLGATALARATTARATAT